MDALIWTAMIYVSFTSPEGMSGVIEMKVSRFPTLTNCEASLSGLEFEAIKYWKSVENPHRYFVTHPSIKESKCVEIPRDTDAVQEEKHEH